MGRKRRASFQLVSANPAVTSPLAAIGPTPGGAPVNSTSPGLSVMTVDA